MTHTLTDLEQLKAIADPLRQRILEGFSRKPMTTKQLAKQLGENANKLYHHVNTLESVGLIEIVETRQNRGTIEKYYSAVARQFVVDHRLLSMLPQSPESSGDLHATIVNALASGLAEARESFDRTGTAAGGVLPSLAGTLHIRIARRQAARFIQELQVLLETLQAAEDEQGECEYSFALAFFPVSSSPGEP